jgi:hypothetical protein
VHGLLGNAMRKNVEQIALGLGEKVGSLQYFVGQSQWEVEPVIAVPLCVYNSETTPRDNLESKAEEKMRCLRIQMVV